MSKLSCPSTLPLVSLEQRVYTVDAKDAVAGAASKAAAGAQRMAGLEPKQGIQQLLPWSCQLRYVCGIV